MDESVAYTSGNWVVTPGNEQAFITRWSEFVEWSKANAAGAGSFFLLRSAEDPLRFLSFGSWRDAETVTEWRSRPEFAELLGKCRALCEDFQGRDYVLAASVGD